MNYRSAIPFSIFADDRVALVYKTGEETTAARTPAEAVQYARARAIRTGIRQRVRVGRNIRTPWGGYTWWYVRPTTEPARRSSASK